MKLYNEKSFEIQEKIKNINEQLENNEKYKGVKSNSISAILGQFTKPFDRDGIAELTYNKHFNDPSSKYYKMTKDNIIKSWEDKAAVSCSYGKNVDSYIELIIEDKDEMDMEMFKLDHNYDFDNRMHGLCDGIDQFFKDFCTEDIICIGRELKMYNEAYDYLSNGRLDSLFYNTKTNKFILVDYKNSGSVDFVNRWEKLYGPLSQYDACNGNTYSIQLYFYKRALIETYGLVDDPDKIDCYIIRFDQQPITEDGKNYEMLTPQNIPYQKDLMDKVIYFGNKKISLQNK